MKFLVLFCLVFICACFIPSGKFDFQSNSFPLDDRNRFLVLSFPHRSNRLQQLLRKQKLHYLGKNQHRFNEPMRSTDYENVMRIRNAWDSGEDYYFQWANQHRRPVEYLAGRKRDTSQQNTLPTRDRRINGGLWRSGLVG